VAPNSVSGQIKFKKDYLVKSYTLNENRLQSQIEKYEALKQLIKLVDSIIDRKPLSLSESEGLLKVIGDFRLETECSAKQHFSQRSQGMMNL